MQITTDSGTFLRLEAAEVAPELLPPTVLPYAPTPSTLPRTCTPLGQQCMYTIRVCILRGCIIRGCNPKKGVVTIYCCCYGTLPPPGGPTYPPGPPATTETIIGVGLSFCRHRLLKFGTKAAAGATKSTPIVTAMFDLPRYDFFPIFLATPHVILHPPSSPPNGCPVSRSMSWSRRRP